MNNRSALFILVLILVMFALYFLAEKLQVMSALVNGRLELPGLTLDGITARIFSGTIIFLFLAACGYVAFAGIRLVRANGKTSSRSDRSDNDGKRIGEN